MQHEFDPSDAKQAIVQNLVQTVELTPDEIRAYFDGEELPENITSALDEAQGEFAQGHANAPQYILIRVRHIS